MLLILSNKNFLQKDFEIGFYLIVENIYFQYRKMELGGLERKEGWKPMPTHTFDNPCAFGAFYTKAWPLC